MDSVVKKIYNFGKHHKNIIHQLNETVKLTKLKKFILILSLTFFDNILLFTYLYNELTLSLYYKPTLSHLFANKLLYFWYFFKLWQNGNSTVNFFSVHPLFIGSSNSFWIIHFKHLTYPPQDWLTNQQVNLIVRILKVFRTNNI